MTRAKPQLSHKNLFANIKYTYNTKSVLTKNTISLKKLFSKPGSSLFHLVQDRSNSFIYFFCWSQPDTDPGYNIGAIFTFYSNSILLIALCTHVFLSTYHTGKFSIMYSGQIVLKRDRKDYRIGVTEPLQMKRQPCVQWSMYFFISPFWNEKKLHLQPFFSIILKSVSSNPPSSHVPWMCEVAGWTCDEPLAHLNQHY